MIGYRITKDDKTEHGYWLWETELTPRYKVMKGDPYKEGIWIRIAWAIHYDLLVHVMHILMQTYGAKDLNGDNQ